MKSVALAAMALWAAAAHAPPAAPESRELAPIGGFENGFQGWTCWGQNADRITLETTATHSGGKSARVLYGHNALYFQVPVAPGQAYELRFFHHLEGDSPKGQVTLSFSRKGGALRSAGSAVFDIRSAPAGSTPDTRPWSEFRQVFLPTQSAAQCQFAFQVDEDSALNLDDVSLRAVPRPAELAEPPDPWQGLKHRTTAKTSRPSTFPKGSLPAGARTARPWPESSGRSTASGASWTSPSGTLSSPRRKTPETAPGQAA
jgi:hypothetical protein